MSRYDIALGKKERFKIVKQSSLDRVIRAASNPNNLKLQEKAAIRLVIADKLFPNSEDAAVDVAADLMDLPDFIASRIANRILGVE
jgi:hypothetical protein